MVKIPYIGNSDTPVSKSEIIGRALDKEKRVFIYEDANSIKLAWDDFDDSRAGNLSVDRLGVGEVNNKIVQAIEPVANKRASGVGLNFLGWSTVKAEKIFKYFPVIPEPISSPEDAKNLFHAGINRGIIANKIEQQKCAATIFAIFYTHGSKYLVTGKNPSLIQKLFAKILNFIG